MKKIILSLAVVAVMFVSCKEAAAEAETVVDSTATEVTEAVEAVTDSAAVAVDSAAAKVEGAADAAVEAVKEEVKK